MPCIRNGILKMIEDKADQYRSINQSINQYSVRNQNGSAKSQRMNEDHCEIIRCHISCPILSPFPHSIFVHWYSEKDQAENWLDTNQNCSTRSLMMNTSNVDMFFANYFTILITRYDPFCTHCACHYQYSGRDPEDWSLRNLNGSTRNQTVNQKFENECSNYIYKTWSLPLFHNCSLWSVFYPLPSLVKVF